MVGLHFNLDDHFPSPYYRIDVEQTLRPLSHEHDVALH